MNDPGPTLRNKFVLYCGFTLGDIGGPITIYVAFKIGVGLTAG
jgi:hypothetical protein